jgi:hypothetical protein
MNDWKAISEKFNEDLNTDEELLVFSESDSDDDKNKKPSSTKKPKVNI